jgi:hypothetical protein
MRNYKRERHKTGRRLHKHKERWMEREKDREKERDRKTK